jgi:hypothetical protein
MINDLFKTSTLLRICFVSQMLPLLSACFKRLFLLTVPAPYWLRIIIES